MSGQVLRFIIESSSVRGVIVRLDASSQQQLLQRTEPPVVRDLLCQAALSAQMMLAHVKTEGRLALQLSGAPGLSLLLVQAWPTGRYRGTASWQEPSGALGGQLMMSFSGGGSEYQGLIDVAGCRDFGEALERYFVQSEQLPTLIVLALGQSESAGMLLQSLPGAQAEQWQHIEALARTLSPEELLTTDSPTVLRRLFHEQNVRSFAPTPSFYECGCSMAQTGAMVAGLGRDDALALIEERGEDIEVRCEFCGECYRFSAEDVVSLCAESSTVPGNETRH